MSVSPEMMQTVSNARSKVEDGTITLAEMRDVIKFIRDQRFASQEANKASGKSKAKGPAKPVRSADELLADFEGL